MIAVLAQGDWAPALIAATGAAIVFLLVVAAYLTGLHDGRRDGRQARHDAVDANARAVTAERRLRQYMRTHQREPSRPTRPSYPGHARVLPDPLPLHDIAPWQDPTVPVPRTFVVHTRKLAAVHG